MGVACRIGAVRNDRHKREEKEGDTQTCRPSSDGLPGVRLVFFVHHRTILVCARGVYPRPSATSSFLACVEQDAHRPLTSKEETSSRRADALSSRTPALAPRNPDWRRSLASS